MCGDAAAKTKREIPKIRKEELSVRKTNRILSLVLAIAMVIGLVPMMSISSSAAYTDKLKFDENGEFTIVQISDIQDDKEVHEDTLEMIAKAMNRYSPDLVVLTGDNIAGGMSESDFQSSVNQFMAPIINAGVPYAVTFGNHDAEDGTLVNTPDRDEQYDYYVSLSNLAIDFDVDSLSHTGTGVIPIYSNDESAIKFAVFPIDTGDYDDNGDYDHAQTDQVEWYEAQAKSLGVPHLVFQHIIVPEIYTTLLVKAESTTSGAIQGHGNWSSNYYILDPSNSTITGSMNEQPCPSAQNGGQYAAMVRTGTMVGNFVGHDHTNNFVGTTSDGVTIGYTQAMTMHSYGTHDPAVRVFNVKEDGTYTTEHITLSQMDMEASGDYEHDTIAGTPTVPTKIVVGASGNGLSQQKLGNTIQLYSVNHKTQALYPNDMEITIDLSSSVTDVTLTPQSGINVSGPTVVADSGGTTKTYTWTITGGTATAGTAAEFAISYNNDGTTLTQYAYSYVDDIATPAGYYFFTRNYRGGNNEDNWNSQEYVMTVLGDTVYGDARYQTDTSLYGYESKEIGTWTTATAGYYDYSGSEDGGFVGMGDANYGLIYTSPARTNARAFYYFTRFPDAGKSPVSTIFVDTSEHTSLGSLGLTVNYWRHSAPDHDLTTTFDIAFKLGDVGYTTSDYSTNTAGTTSISANISSITLAAARGSNANFSITGTIPADGTQYTMISHGYSYWNENYDTPHNTYAPVLLRFTLYNKAALRELVNAERSAMRQTDDIVYRAAFKEAYKQVAKVNTTQADIDAAISMLNAAVTNLNFDGVEVSNNSTYAGTTTIPPVIYIAGSGYGISAQPTGTTLQKGVVNFGTGTLNTDYSKFTFAAPQGATGVSVSVTESNGNTVEYTWASDTCEGQITGGTSAQNAYLLYKFTYTLGDKTYEQIEASAVLPAPQPSGWAMYVRRGGTNIRNIVETSVYFADIGALPAGAYYTGTTGDSSELTSVNFNGSDFSSQRSLGGIGMNVWQGLVDGVEDRIYGNDNDVWDDTSRDGGYRARMKIVLDTSVISDLGSIGMGMRYQGLQSASATGVIKSTSDLFVIDADFYDGAVNIDYIKNTAGKNSDTTQLVLTDFINSAGGTESSGTVNSTNYIARYGTKEENDPYLIATLYSAYGIPATGEYTYWTQVYEWNDAWSNQELYAHALWSITVEHVNKTDIRNLVAQEDEYYRQLTDGYSDANGKFTAYQNALAKAKAAVTDVTISDSETTVIMNALQTAINELEYLPADYTALNAKVLQVRIQNTDGTYSYRPHPSNDPTYYNTGLYYSWDCFSSTNEIDIPIKDIVWTYDIRYQNKVDMMVEAIDVGWINVRLVNADYTNVDKFLSYKDGTGANGAAGGASILAPDKYDYLKLTDPMIPAEYYTTATYNAWTNACAAGQSNRSLKKPDQAVVDGYAAALETAYNNLTLLGADYTPLDDVEEVVQENINVTVEVVDPSNSANNYDIPYYSPEIIAQINAKLAERDETLTIVEQDKITALVAEIDALYVQLSETLNGVDMTFANEQKAIEATYEAEAEKYYTAESWARLVAAREAVNDKLASRQADSQVTVNAAAQEVYDARIALEYNEADYSVVNEYLALIAEAEANKDWYTNWSAVDVAVAAVVTGLDVTEQDRVDTMAANLKAAYDALQLKDASYTTLKAAIDLAAEKDKDAKYYTTDTYAAFKAAYDAANTLYTEGQTTPLKINEQATIDNAEAALRDAMAALKYQDANIQPLVTAMEKYTQTVYDGMYMGEYPDEDGDGDEDILDSVKAAYAVAEQWLADYNAGNLTVKDDASIALAANTLESLRAVLPASYVPVFDALYDPYTGEQLYDCTTDGKLSAYITTLEAELKVQYTDESVKAVVDALKAVNYNLTIDNQATVDEMAVDVIDAVALLEYRPADLTELNNAIAAGDAKVALADSTDWFTPDSWAAYEEAYNAAVDVRDADPAYVITEQDIVDEAAQALADATAALEYVDADYAALNEAIETANGLNESDWTSESWADLEAALAEAEAVEEGLKIDSQADIDAKAADLVEAINNLKSASLELVGIGDTVIDNTRGFIYGLVDADIEEITDIVTQGYAEVIGNGYVKCTPVAGNSNLGTGAVVELIRGEDDGDDTNNEVVKTYYIVIFGDLNGDAFITNDDIYDLTQYAAWNDTEYDYESQMNLPQVFAMDIDANGEANLDDAYYVLEYGAWNIDSIKQTYTGQ